MFNKKSFFQKFTGKSHFEDEEEAEEVEVKGPAIRKSKIPSREETFSQSQSSDQKNEEDEEEGQLTVDVYQSAKEIIVQTMTAGVRPEDLQITITRDMITIRGKREEARNIHEDDYFVRELYWGAFSRTILLPQEVEPEEAEAVEKHGLLMIKLPKVDKEKKSTVKVKSL